MRKAEDVEEPKAVVQEQAAKGDLAVDDGVAVVKEEQGIPKKKDQTERQNATLDAVEAAWHYVLKAKATTAEKYRPVKSNWQTSI